MLVLPVTKRTRSLCILICIMHVDQWDEETQFFGIILYREICCEFVPNSCSVQRLIMPWRLKENQKPSWNIDGSRPQAVASNFTPGHYTLHFLLNILHIYCPFEEKTNNSHLVVFWLAAHPIRLQSFNLILANLGSDPASQLSESGSANQHQHKYKYTNTNT